MRSNLGVRDGSQNGMMSLMAPNPTGPSGSNGSKVIAVLVIAVGFCHAGCKN